MLRTTLKFVLLIALIVGGSTGLYIYQTQDTAAQKLKESENRNEKLRLVVQRLTSEKRVADVIVTDQQLGADGKPATTTLLLVEYARDNSPLPGKTFTIQGDVAHIDAMVVKFEGRYVEENDPLRGHSIALFTRLFGDKQAPENAFPIDRPNKVPEIYRGAPPELIAFEKDLWSDFWKLADDASYRQKMGVRVAQGEGVWRAFKPDSLYTLSIESDGGLNITSEPLKGIYREAMKRAATLPSNHS